MSSSITTTPTTGPRKRWLLLLGCVAVVSAGVYLWKSYTRPTPAQPPSVTMDGLEEEIQRVLSKSRERVIAAPTSQSWGQYGMVLQAHALTVQADVCFREAARLDNSDPRWPYYQGLNALQHDSANALSFLRKAFELSPATGSTHSAVTLRLAEALFEFGKLQEAETLFRKELNVDPMNPRVNYGLALIQIARGDAKSAEKHLQLAVTSSFARKKATVQLAVVCRQLGKEDAALQYQSEVASLPEDIDWLDQYIADYIELQVGLQSRFQEAERLQSEGKQMEAAQKLLALAESQPSPRTYLAVAVALTQLRDFAAAERYTRACLTLDPSNMQANYLLALTLYYQAEALGDSFPSRDRAKSLYQESAQAARRCLDKKPDYALAHQFLARALIKIGKKAEAIQHYKDAITCRPETVEAHVELAEALLSNEQWEDAAKSIAALEQMVPNSDKRLEALKKGLAKKGKS